MQSVHQVSPDGGGNKGLVKLNYQAREEHKKVRNGVTREDQGLSQEDESGINEVVEDVNGGHAGGITPPVHEASPWKPQLPQQQPLGPVVRWEKFLPRRSLKVLLVENDDSTRQVVGALLRNCSYEVTAAANGQEAWKILENLSNHVDIVLTEVLMPCLSGIGLLCKIMSHKTCKNIPVIMMSSHDSMGIVFKCLSKGAVDFLVKPVRKNELKNLWQHVWRRCHSPSVSGSESGTQTQKYVQSKSVEDSDNNTGSNDEDDNASIGLNIRDGSDNGSGTQSSWTKRAAEVDSSQPVSPWDQLADHDSTCALVIHPKSEPFCNEWVPMTGTKESQEKKELLDNDFMGKDLEIGVPRNQDLELESHPSEKVSTNPTCTLMNKLSKSDPTEKDNQQINEGLRELERSNAASELSSQAADLIGAIANSANEQMVTRVIKPSNGPSNISEGKDKSVTDAKELPSLDLSLKRLRSIAEGGIPIYDDRNVMRHSDLSAFSRYNTSAASSRAPTGYGGSCSLPLDNSSEAMKMESTYNMISNSNANPLNQGSNGSCNNNDMGSTFEKFHTKPAAFTEKSESSSTVKGPHASTFHAVHQTCATQQVIQEKIGGVAEAARVVKPRGTHHQVQVQHHHHHYHHHHHHHVDGMQQQQLQSDHDKLSLNNMAARFPQCGSSNVFGGPIEGITGNYSPNESNSVGNHGSNVQNGSRTAVNAGAVNMEKDDGVTEKSGAGGGNVSGSGSGSGVDQNRFAQRVAALTKFRQKRKERCFDKKVRYQSRKKLAEQRPRVRGQFVRQTVHERTSRSADC